MHSGNRQSRETGSGLLPLEHWTCFTSLMFGLELALVRSNQAYLLKTREVCVKQVRISVKPYSFHKHQLQEIMQASH
jgi:hypothetical protein